MLMAMDIGNTNIVLGVYEEDAKVIDALHRMADALKKYSSIK